MPTTNHEAGDLLFLDANVLFSAAYREYSGLLRLWNLKNAKLVTSPYALDEARRNLREDEQKARLDKLVQAIKVTEELSQGKELPPHIDLPQKDRPILIAAIEARATHLITGDFRDFGKYYGQKINGVTILPPADYLKSKKK